MSKITNAIEFYYEMAELKKLIRQGAVQWNVKRPRLESVAEHIALTETLAIALVNQLDLKVDMGYLLTMINFHEIGELKIGDLTVFDNPETETKHRLELSHAESLFSKLKNSEYFIKMFDDFNNGYSFEAKFAKACDKFENVLEFKKYFDAKQVSLSHATPEMLAFPKLKKLLGKGITDLDDVWFIYHMPAFESFGITQEVWNKEIKPLKTPESK